MSPANISPAREASPRHRKRGFIRSSRRTRGFLTEHQDEIVANVDGDIQNASSSLGASDEAVIIQKLEQKRMQLDAQIAQYISEKQREYDTSERELYQSTEEKDDSSEKNETPSKETVGKLDSRGRTTKKSRNLSLPSSRAIWAPATTSQDSSEEGEPAQGSRTPTHEREKEFHGLFTPFFLPLLDAGSRSNSAPPVPSATADGSPDPTQGYQSDSAGRQQVRRAVTEPFVKPALSKKSALRSPKKSPDRKKRVSLIIDDEIVRPSESPKDTHLPPTPTDEEAPNVAMTDRDGTPIHVWVPEKARLPYPDEDALDYVIAVGGTLYQGADVPDSYPAAGKVLGSVSQAPKDDSEGAPLQRFPSDSLHSIDSTAHTFAWSPPQNENVFGMSPNWDGSALPKPSAPIEEPKHSPASPDPPVISPPEAAYTLPQEQAPSPTPKKAAPANSPPRSPRSPLSASFSRHAPSYIDKFSTTSNRVFGNMADDAAPAAEEAGLAYLDDGGPSSSYVGGLGGSGIDAVDIGSAGYPSSLGASYMEQFAAARAMDQRAKLREEQEKERRADEASELERAASHDDRPEDEAFLGEMDDF